VRTKSKKKGRRGRGENIFSNHLGNTTNLQLRGTTRGKVEKHAGLGRGKKKKIKKDEKKVEKKKNKIKKQKKKKREKKKKKKRKDKDKKLWSKS